MGKYNFDEEIDRHNTGSLKYDFAVERGKPADVLPLWVADMDFRVPPCVTEALTDSVNHGIFGYSEVKEDYNETVRRWFSKRFSWDTESEWIVKTPGVVFALSMAVRAFTREGDGVIISTPVYYPFFELIRDNNRKVVESPLVLKDNHYEVDFENFEKQIIENKVKMFILCSPHNPVGKVWTEDELRRLAEIAKKHDVFVASDEIHCDIVRKGYKHLPFLKVNPDMKDCTIVCTAPSKTFNLAGLQASNIFIPASANRARFIKEIECAGYSQLNTMGLVACKAAYEGGEEWLEELTEYFEENLSIVRDFVNNRFRGVKLIEPQGTYFAWLDFTELKLTREQLDDLIINKAKLWLDAGHIFGSTGDGFQRVAYACTHRTLIEAMERIDKAIKSL